MPQMAIALVRPAVALVPSYLEFIAEMRALGETIWSSRVPAESDGPDAFVAQLLAKETHAELPMVRETLHWAVAEPGRAHVVGLIALRHELTPRLAQFGGHVGYEVRPSCRRRGIATAMLRLLLATERARALGRILVTCGPANVGSRKAIEANGGALAGVVFVHEVQRETCHYWIDVPR